MNFCQLSNVLGFFPILLALQYGLYPLAGAMTLSTVLSILYHYDETNENALLADMAGCVLVIACGFYIVMNSETNLTFANLLSVIYAVMATVFFIKAGEPNEDTYQLYHTAWHICAFYSMSVFVFSYIHSTVIPEETQSRIARDLKPALQRTLTFIPRGITTFRERWGRKVRPQVPERRVENTGDVQLHSVRHLVPHQELRKGVPWKGNVVHRCAYGPLITVAA